MEITGTRSIRTCWMLRICTGKGGNKIKIRYVLSYRVLVSQIYMFMCVCVYIHIYQDAYVYMHLQNVY